MSQITVHLAEGLVSLIERLDYEQRASRLLLVDAAERGLQQTDAFRKWEEHYTEAYSEYEVAKAELERTYVLGLTNGQPFHWKLDYQSCDVVITMEGCNEAASQ